MRSAPPAMARAWSVGGGVTALGFSVGHHLEQCPGAKARDRTPKSESVETMPPWAQR